MKRIWLLILAGILLVFHLTMSWIGTKRQSIVWDEIVYPAAGLAQWKTGKIGINREHPFLSKLISSAPLLLINPRLPFDDQSWRDESSYRFGYKFVFGGDRDPQHVVEASRCPMAFMSVASGIILFIWLYSLWGPVGAVGGLVCFVSTPVLASRSSLALLEMPQFFFLTLCLALWSEWVRKSRMSCYWASCIAGGLAVACKLTALVIVGTMVVVESLRPALNDSFKKKFGRALLWGIGVGVVFCSLYLPWKDGWSSLKFALLFPFSIGDTYNTFYWGGGLYPEAPSLLTWGAFFVKSPPFVLALAGMGAWAWIKSGQERILFWAFVVFAGAPFVSVLFMKTALSTVQISAVYLFLAVLAGGIGARRWGRLGRVGLILLAVGAVSDMAWSRANPLAYFNFFVGGKNQGYRWLADSDQDWGQWLPQLKSYWDEQGRPGLLLAYSGASDPSAYGLVFQDLVSSALYVREPRETEISINEKRVLLAVGTKMLQSEPRLFAWLQNNLKPIAQPDPCFFVYDLTGNAEAFRWVAALYSITKRPHRAQWANERADSLSQ